MNNEYEIDIDENLRNEIKKDAYNMVKSLFERAEQLEKLDIFLSKERKKVKKNEEGLQNLIKSHVENLKSMIQELRMASVEAGCLQNGIKEVHNLIDDYSKIEKKIDKLIICSQTASIITQTLNLLTQIINMNSTLESTCKLLDEMQLLQVHKNLRELENIRDRIFSKHFDTISLSISDSVKFNEKKLLIKNFEPINMLSNNLLSKIKLILNDIPYYAENNPTTLVTVIRIIEREEHIDEYWINLQRNNDSNLIKYIPNDRPKKWASEIDLSIYDTCNKKINDIKLKINFNDKLALAEYLELIRSFYFKDILSIQTHAQRCFPPSYQILVRYCNIYHKIMRDIINDIILNWGDNSNEHDIVTILLFEKDYYNELLFGNKKFDNTVLKCIKNNESLISLDIIQKLEHSYLIDVCENITLKVSRIISIEKRLIESDNLPNIILNKYCTFNNTFYDDFVGVKIKNATKLSYNTFNGVFTFCIVGYEQFVSQYENLFQSYINIHFKLNKNQSNTNINTFINIFKFSSDKSSTFTSDKSEELTKYPYFVEYCMSIINNCIIVKSSLSQLCNDVVKELVKRPENRQKSLELCDILGDDTYNRIIHLNGQIDELISKCNTAIASDYLYELRSCFDDFLTTKWKDNPQGWSSGLHNSLLGFNELLYYLDNSYHHIIYTYIDKGLTLRYLSKFFNYKIKYNIDDIKIYGEILFNDAQFLSNFFIKHLNISLENTYSYAMLLCCSVFKNIDPNCSLIDIAKIFKTFSDFTREHGIALLSKRADLSKDKIYETVNGIIDNLRLISDSKSGLFCDIKIMS